MAEDIDNLKVTSVGRIPEEWKIVKLKDIVEKENDIVAGPFGSNLKVSDYRDSGTPIIRLQNIERNRFVNKDLKYISREKAEELSYHSFKSGDIVLSKLGDPESIGRACIVPDYLGEGIVTSDVVKISISSNEISKFFLEYVLNSFITANQLRKETIGSTRPRVNISQVRNLKIPFPSFEEQQKIAEILSTIDNSIQKVDDAIEKTERLKKGLMQELLTKGIGHEDFKDTEVGKVPKKWRVVNLESVVEIHDSKRIPLSEMERSKRKGDYPYCGANGIIDYINDYIFEGEFVLLAEDGGDFKKFGDSAYKMSGKFWVNNHAHILRAIKGEAINSFLLYHFNYIDIRRYILGSTRTKLNQGQMRKIKISLPPINEQQKIAEILSTVDEKLDLERKRKERLERVKKGLMNDLLTGRRRVRVENSS